MMSPLFSRLFLVILIVVSICASLNRSFGQDTAPDLDQAKELFLTGEYEQAGGLYEKLGKTTEYSIKAACGRAEIALILCKFKEGLQTLATVEPGGKRSADWHASKAGLLAEVGEYDTAINENKFAIAIERDHFRASWQLGQLLEMLGRYNEAVEAYEVFDRVMTGDELPEEPEQLTWLAKGFHRFSVLKKHPNLTQRTKHILTEVLQEAGGSGDSLYWPATLAGAELLLEKHNLAEAKADFERVLKQNSKVPASHVGLGRIEMENFAFEEIEKHAKQALEIAPNYLPAHLLLAERYLTQDQFEDATNSVQAALKTNPNSIEALALLASIQLRVDETPNYPPASLTTQRRIEKIVPNSAISHQIIGTWLAWWRQFRPAECRFGKAAAIDPTWAAPLASLGQVYMDTGEEKKARKMLDEAFKIDAFDKRTHSLLGLLDRLERFSQLETKHFIVKYDPKEDEIIAPYFAEKLESFYETICTNYDYHPDKKTLVEVFPDHMGFSMRTDGRPFIGTIGACTGRVIAMAAPRGRRPFGRFNWAHVLRHEFTHTVTLAATEGAIPRWVTEGLAVLEEETELSAGTKQLLSNAARNDELFRLSTINWGFIRPKKPHDRGLAYAQSAWMLGYLREREGPDILKKLVAQLQPGISETRAFKALGIDVDAFERDFKKWAQEQVRSWDLPHEDKGRTKDLKKKLKESPDDPDLLALKAEAELLDGEFDSAEEISSEILEKNKNHRLALEVMCRVLIGRMLGKKEETERKEFLEESEPYIKRLRKIDVNNHWGLKFEGYLEQAAENWPKAISLFKEYQKRFPEDPDTRRRLAAIYIATRQPPLAIAQLEQLYKTIDNDPGLCRQIAELHSQVSNPSEASRWYREALHIDIYDPENHQGLADASFAAGDISQAEREYQVVCKILPEEPVGYEGLSRVYQALGNPEKAETYRKMAETKKPNGSFPESN